MHGFYDEMTAMTFYLFMFWEKMGVACFAVYTSILGWLSIFVYTLFPPPFYTRVDCSIF